jgi:hypothetical protein
MTLADYDEVVEALRGIYNSINQTCEPNSCPQSAWSGCIVRFAAHDFLDFREGTGGSDACLALNDILSSGLNDCWAGTEQVLGLVQVYEDFCTRMSLADFIVIAAEAVMTITREAVLKVDPTRQPVDFRSQFMFGRVTATDCISAVGKMPNAEKGCAQVSETLVDGLGLTWKQAAALMGGHTIGGMQPGRSGYTGRWTSANSSRLFNNDYYVSMVLSGWGPIRHIEGQQYKNQWTRVDIGVNEFARGLETMLDTDMCLYYSMFDKPVDEEEDFAALNAVSAQLQNCGCAWSSSVEYSEAIEKYNEGKFCGSTVIYPSYADGSFDASEAHSAIPSPLYANKPSADTLNFTRQRLVCCSTRSFGGSPNGDDQAQLKAVEPAMDCGIPGQPLGHAAAEVKLFANSEEAWINSFLEAWGVATTKTSAHLYKLAD